MKKLSWLDAAETVLEDKKKAMHYTDIAQLILENQYLTTAGPTPHQTINSILNTDINKNKERSRFVKVGRGEYILRKFVDYEHLLLTEEDSPSTIPGVSLDIEQLESPNKKIINAFGIYWNRSLVHWKTYPDLLGLQQIGASEVNFRQQKGIYLLHDNRETIYVGQAIDQTLGQRLKHHTTDRLSGRWDRFSWFGFHSVLSSGDLELSREYENITIQELGDTLEAILIESLEPRQNRKQGNTFWGLEYLQREAPEIKKKQKEELIRELTDKL